MKFVKEKRNEVIQPPRATPFWGCILWTIKIGGGGREYKGGKIENNGVFRSSCPGVKLKVNNI